MMTANVEKIVGFKSDHAEPMAYLISHMIGGEWENNPQRFIEILKRRDAEKWPDAFLENPWVRKNLPLAVKESASKLLGAVIDQPSELSRAGLAHIREGTVTLRSAAWKAYSADDDDRGEVPQGMRALFDDAVAALTEEVLDQAAKTVRDPELHNPQLIPLRNLLYSPVPLEDIFLNCRDLSDFEALEGLEGLSDAPSGGNDKPPETLEKFFERFFSVCENELESLNEEESQPVSREEMHSLKDDLQRLKYLPEMEAWEADEVLHRIGQTHKNTIEALGCIVHRLPDEEHVLATEEKRASFKEMLMSFITAYYVIIGTLENCSLGRAVDAQGEEVTHSNVAPVDFWGDRQTLDAILDSMRLSLNGMVLIGEERDALLWDVVRTNGLPTGPLEAMDAKIKVYLLHDAQQVVAEVGEGIAAEGCGKCRVNAKIWETYARGKGETEIGDPLGLDDTRNEGKIYETLLSRFLEAMFAQAQRDVEAKAAHSSSSDEFKEIHGFLDAPMECIPVPGRQELLAVTRRRFLQWAGKVCQIRTGCEDEADLLRPEQAAFSRLAERVGRLPDNNSSEAEAELKDVFRQGEGLLKQLDGMQSLYAERRNKNSMANYMFLMLGHIHGKLEEMFEDLALKLGVVHDAPPVPATVLMSVADCFGNEKVAACPAAANDVGI